MSGQVCRRGGATYVAYSVLDLGVIQTLARAAGALGPMEAEEARGAPGHNVRRSRA